MKFKKARLLNRRHVYSGKIVDLIVDQIEIDGHSYIREVVRHPGGVVVLGETEDGKIPFVRQVRYPLDRELIELPAGKIDRGEDPATSAAREMEEETGYRPERMTHVFSFYATPGFCDEFLHLYHSDALTKTTPQREPDEEIVVELHTLEAAIALAMQGQIVDGKSLVALFWLDWHRRTQSREANAESLDSVARSELKHRSDS